MSARLNWNDPAAVSRWLLALRVAVDDADEVARDLLRPSRKRSLGPRLHRSLYTDAVRSIRTLLAYAEPAPPNDLGPGEGGASPVH